MDLESNAYSHISTSYSFRSRDESFMSTPAGEDIKSGY